jgi:molybdopterin-binding protein
MAEITIDVDSQELTATISLGAVERLELSLGDRVTAIIKSTDVLVGK